MTATAPADRLQSHDVTRTETIGHQIQRFRHRQHHREEAATATRKDPPGQHVETPICHSESTIAGLRSSRTGSFVRRMGVCHAVLYHSRMGRRNLISRSFTHPVERCIQGACPQREHAGSVVCLPSGIITRSAVPKRVTSTPLSCPGSDAFCCPRRGSSCAYSRVMLPSCCSAASATVCRREPPKNQHHRRTRFGAERSTPKQY